MIESNESGKQVRKESMLEGLNRELRDLNLTASGTLSRSENMLAQISSKFYGLSDKASCEEICESPSDHFGQIGESITMYRYLVERLHKIEECLEEISGQNT